MLQVSGTAEHDGGKEKGEGQDMKPRGASRTGGRGREIRVYAPLGPEYEK